MTAYGSPISSGTCMRTETQRGEVQNTGGLEAELPRWIANSRHTRTVLPLCPCGAQQTVTWPTYYPPKQQLSYNTCPFPSPNDSCPFAKRKLTFLNNRCPSLGPQNS